jgi:alkylation response protein AidB-like acyl-CoA dehydrogenase
MQDYPWWNDAQKWLMADSRRFTTEVLTPLAERSVYKREYPWAAVREIAKKGWFGATIPEKYGGHLGEWGVTGACILTEEVSRAGVLGAAYTTCLIGATAQLVHNGSEEQKQRWLPGLAKGDLLGCITMTEPYAGSDIAEIETTGVRDGDYFVVNGIKRFQTNAAAADLYMTYVKSSEDPAVRAKYGHLTGMIMEKGMPGFHVERVNDWAGSAGMYNCYLRFDDVRVPRDNVIGAEGDGWRVMMDGLNVERIVNGATYLGEIREAIRYARQHLERRVQFRQTTGSIPVNQFKLADMYAKYQMSRLIVFYAAYAADLGRDVPIEAGLCKLFASDAQLEVAIEAIQCMGGNGVMQIYPAERYMRDAKLNQIAAGTNEILRLLIYRMGNKEFAADLQPPIRVIDEELQTPLPLGKAPPPKPIDSETDVLKVLAENYRVNPGLHMTIGDIKQFLDAPDDVLLQHLASLEEKGLASQFKNRRGQVEMAKATLRGIKAANPPEYYRHIPSWVLPEDVF